VTYTYQSDGYVFRDLSRQIEVGAAVRTAAPGLIDSVVFRDNMCSVTVYDTDGITPEADIDDAMALMKWRRVTEDVV